LKLRNPATAPAVGDRIPYLVIQGDKKAKLKDHIEDPLYVLENNIAIDTQYYIDQLIAPLGRLFGPMMENAEAFFMHGDHTTKKTMPIQHNKGLGSFFTKRESCLGCKVPLGVQEKTMCFYCRDKQEDIYMSHLSDSRQKEMAFNRLWTHCQQCQGNMHVEVICSAYVFHFPPSLSLLYLNYFLSHLQRSDCPIFYKRIKAMHDHRSSLANLSKFDLTW
jgi:DNA polymerase delta subunit 1